MSFRRFIALSAVFALLAGSGLASQGKISGIITSQVTEEAIPDANVIILETGWGAVSRDGGFYFIDHIPTGTYDLHVSVLGYKPVTETVRIEANAVHHFKLQPTLIEFDPVVVTATLSEHLQSHVSASTEIFTRARINELNGHTGAELFESIGGVYSKSYDGIAGVNTPSIRGSNADQVLILMDGIRLNTAQGGGVDLNTIPVSVLDRVEIIRGGHSAVLGSDAVGGTINLISKSSIQSKGYNYGFQSTLGSFGNRIQTVHGSHQIGPVAVLANYNRMESDGNFEYQDPLSKQTEERLNNDSSTEDFFIKGQARINDRNTVQLLYHTLHTEKGVAGSVNLNPWSNLSMTTPNARADIKRNIYKLESKNQLSNRLFLKSQIGLHEYDYGYKNSDDLSDDLHKDDSFSANGQAIYTFSNDIVSTIGINYQKDDLTSTQFKNVDSRKMTSLFGQLELHHNVSIAQLHLIPAVRWDHYSDVGAQTSPKLGIMVKTTGAMNVALRSNIGESYRVPSLNDLYWPEQSYGPGYGGVGGNVNLKPELGRNFDVGLVFSLQRNALIRFESTYFHNEIENLIVWTSDEEMWWHPNNVGKATMRGLENGIEVRLPSNMAYVNLYYTHMNATEGTPDSPNRGKRLIYRPDDKWDIWAGVKLGKMSANINYRLVSKSYINADNSKSLDAYQLLGANIGAQFIIRGFKLHAKLQGLNLFDKMIFLNDGYPLPGREFRLTVGLAY
ncbi:TonB-dependent receptor [candidate division KSB1 bacterium]|nr:TonB-dependent receptor [candidate division KSB1 bacterium]